MQKPALFLFTLALLLVSAVGCEPEGVIFNSIKLVSSRNENVYINTVNLGLTSDKQQTIITKDRDRLRDPQDTANAVSGLEPFVFSFENDSLKLYFNHSVSYHVRDSFQTITIVYYAVENSDFVRLVKLSVSDENIMLRPPERMEDDEKKRPCCGISFGLKPARSLLTTT